ncbi:MAG: DUF4249 domain-containing protein [Bacteroidota bacterium]
MKKLKTIGLLLVFAVAFASCEKVIDIDLNTASSKYVIEGAITNSAGPYSIKITKTKNFDEDNNYEGVAGANVTVSDNAGNSETLMMSSPGIYQTSALAGVPGRTYHLNVEINGEVFTSASVMANPVNMDSVFVFDFTGFGDTIKLINVVYNDPAGIPNFYKHDLIVNGKKDKSINISSDQASDGSRIDRGLFYRNDGEGLISGDSVTIEMMCIDEPVHFYLFSLDQTISQSAAAPANPVSNIKGGALGYFSAQTFQKKSLVVQ